MSSSTTKEWEISLLESEQLHNMFIHNFFNTNIKSNDIMMNELIGKDGWIELDDEMNENDTTYDTIGSNSSLINRSPPTKSFVTLFPSISLVTQKSSTDQEEAPNRIGFSEKIGKRLLCPPSPLSNKVSHESLISLQLSCKSSGGSLLSNDEAIIKSENIRRSKSVESNISNTSSNNQNLSLLLHNFSNDSSMNCQASCSDSSYSPTTVTRVTRTGRIDSSDSLNSNSSSVEYDANNGGIFGSLNLKVVDDSLREWQSQSPVAVRREDAVMALIQEEFHLHSTFSRNRSISAPIILCESANISLTKNSFSSPSLVRSKTVSSLDKKKTPTTNSDFRLNKKTRSLDDIPEEEHSSIGHTTYELAKKVLSKEKLDTFLEMNNFAYRVYWRTINN
jgi:hypothetical protein